MLFATNEAAETVEKVTDGAAHQVNIFRNLITAESLQTILVAATRIIIVLVILTITYRMIRFLIQRTMRLQKRRLDPHGAQQITTVATLGQSILFYTFIFLGIMAVLSILGYNMRGLATSAGLAGVLVAFVSQSIIRDWICGIFIIVDRQYHVGDVVKLGTIMGRVKNITIRATVIESMEHEIIYVPNGSITQIINYSKLPITHYFDVGIGYDSPLDKAKLVLEEAAREVNQLHKATLSEEVVLLGVQDLGASAVVMRFCFSCPVLEEYAIKRSLREEIKKALDREGITIPFQTLTLVQDSPKQKEET